VAGASPGDLTPQGGQSVRYSWSFFSSSGSSGEDDGEEEMLVGAERGAGGSPLERGAPASFAPYTSVESSPLAPPVRLSGALAEADLSLCMSARKGERPRGSGLLEQPRRFLREITNALQGRGGGAQHSSSEWQGRVQDALRKSARLGHSLELDLHSRRESQSRTSCPGPPAALLRSPRRDAPLPLGVYSPSQAPLAHPIATWRSADSQELAGLGDIPPEPRWGRAFSPRPYPGTFPPAGEDELALRQELEETRLQMRRLAGRLEEQSQARVELAEGYQKLCARYEAAMRDQDGAMELQAQRSRGLEEQHLEALGAVRRLEEELRGRRTAAAQGEEGSAALLQRARTTCGELREELREARSAAAMREAEHAELMAVQQDEAAAALARQTVELQALRADLERAREALAAREAQGVSSPSGDEASHCDSIAGAARGLDSYEHLSSELLARLEWTEAERTRLEHTLTLCWEKSRPYLPRAVCLAAPS